jgi:hypothetical protein
MLFIGTRSPILIARTFRPRDLRRVKISDPEKRPHRNLPAAIMPPTYESPDAAKGHQVGECEDEGSPSHEVWPLVREIGLEEENPPGDPPPASRPDCVPPFQTMFAKIIAKGPGREANRLNAKIARLPEIGAQPVLELIIRDQPSHQATNGPPELVSRRAIHHRYSTSCTIQRERSLKSSTSGAPLPVQ